MLDVFRILKDFHVPYDTSVNQGWANVQCPFCGDHGMHGGFNLSGEYFSCWKCGGHKLEYVLRKILHVDKAAYLSILEQYTTETVIRAKLNRKTAKGKHLELPGDDLNPVECKYLSRRGFDVNLVAKKYSLRGGGIAGRWAYRIIIPIYLNRQLVSWTARDITGKQDIRYKNLSIEESVVDPKTVLFNIDNARGNTVYVVEGPFDTIRMGDGFVSSFGTSMEESQLGFLARHFEEVYFMFDPESDAQKKARKYAEMISAMGRTSGIIDMEYECDPGDLTDDQARKLRWELGL